MAQFAPPNKDQLGVLFIGAALAVYLLGISGFLSGLSFGPLAMSLCAMGTVLRSRHAELAERAAMWDMKETQA